MCMYVYICVCIYIYIHIYIYIYYKQLIYFRTLQLSKDQQAVAATTVTRLRLANLVIVNEL